MANPYESWVGSGMGALMTTGVFKPPAPDGKPVPESEWNGIEQYLPTGDLGKYLVLRFAPDGTEALTLDFNIEWNRKIAQALKALTFVQQDPADENRLQSKQDFNFSTGAEGWDSVGPVTLIRNFDPRKPAITAKIVFQSRTDPSNVVGAYWCWEFP
jgi:hypothetical protein